MAHGERKHAVRGLLQAKFLERLLKLDQVGLEILLLEVTLLLACVVKLKVRVFHRMSKRSLPSSG